MAQLRGDRGSTSLYGLNRRDIDVLLKDWCNSHRDMLGSRRPDDSQLEAVGKFMMAIGAKLDEPDGELWLVPTSVTDWLYSCGGIGGLIDIARA